MIRFDRRQVNVLRKRILPTLRLAKVQYDTRRLDDTKVREDLTVYFAVCGLA
jgi:hypothetical protein